jgi:hydrogenase maturation protein HypF
MAERRDRLSQPNDRREEMLMAITSSVRIERVRVVLRGAVQGVGFRPTVYRLAERTRLAGWVRNTSAGLEIEVEGTSRQLDCFLHKLRVERPRAAVVAAEEVSRIAPTGGVYFEILPSEENAAKTAAVLPDLATCPECLREVLDPADRRFGYVFTNCTLCGPRYTILNDIPYDRPNTTMASFVLCPACRREYESVHDRRFHAQPNACPVCGPRLWSAPGKAEGVAAIAQAAEALARGQIVALKGIGGFQLFVDARNPSAVTRLRIQKCREEKPFALLMPSLAMVRRYCILSAMEEELLSSPAAPIVLLRRSEARGLAVEVAKSSRFLGVLLPYSPLHHLLMARYPFPVVATSGNRANEPIATENDEACERLKDIADVFLLHNRAIARPCDDSVARCTAGRPQILRRARGYAPLAVDMPHDLPPVLAVGGHMKNTVAIALGRQVFVSQHVGDLDALESRRAFERAIADLCRLYRFEPKTVACDLHPDYASTQWALASGLPTVRVQHHHAHVLACMAENGIAASALGVAWDGTGYGPDGTIWGGEFLREHRESFVRVAHFRTFRLPGGETAIQEPRRAAMGLLYEIFGPALFAMKELAPVASFTAPELTLLHQMLEKNINAPVTSSAGRIFDAVSSLAGIRQISRFEGQGAMELELALDGVTSDESYPLRLSESRFDADGRQSALIVDWQPLTLAIIHDLRCGVPTGNIAAKFHNTMIECIVAVARRVNENKVALTGGCFQNHYLSQRAVERLQSEGFTPYWHQRIPPNDGGLVLGQIIAAAKTLKGK